MVLDNVIQSESKLGGTTLSEHIKDTYINSRDIWLNTQKPDDRLEGDRSTTQDYENVEDLSTGQTIFDYKNTRGWSAAHSGEKTIGV